MGIQLKDFVIEDSTLIRGQVYDRLKEAILSGQIPMGSKVLEGRLAEQLKVSRTPVREALHILEKEGFLEVFPRVGYQVRRITLEEALEIYEMRAALEPLAARKALAREDQTYTDHLEQAIAKSEAAGMSGDLEDFLLYDSTFDEIIVRASGMKMLFDIWETLRNRLKLYRMGVQNSESTRFKAVSGHRRILRCLKNKDDKGVEKAIKDHLEDFRQDIGQFAFEWERGGTSHTGIKTGKL
jgi:GntR family transcriptional regulator, rspAB operon transcriptional repressor